MEVVVASVTSADDGGGVRRRSDIKEPSGSDASGGTGELGLEDSDFTTREPGQEPEQGHQGVEAAPVVDTMVSKVAISTEEIAGDHNSEVPISASDVSPMADLKVEALPPQLQQASDDVEQVAASLDANQAMDAELGANMADTTQQASEVHNQAAYSQDDEGSPRDETEEDVSDISASSDEASGGVADEWMEAGPPGAEALTRNRSFTICSVITNTSDHGSIRDQRANVDRLLMSGTGGPGGIGRGGGSLAGSDISPGGRPARPGCMERPHPNMSNSDYAYTYDRNYYKSPSDWLRFVPRRNSQDTAHDGGGDRRPSSSSGSPSWDASGSGSFNHGYAYNNAGLLGSAGGNVANPDSYYRGFDNTRIRMGFGHNRHAGRIRSQMISQQQQGHVHPHLHHQAAAAQHFNHAAVGSHMVGPNGEIIGTPSTVDAGLSMEMGMAGSGGFAHHPHMYPNMISGTIDEEEGLAGERESGDIEALPLEIHVHPNQETGDMAYDIGGNDDGDQRGMMHAHSADSQHPVHHELGPQAQEHIMVKSPSQGNDGDQQDVTVLDPRVAFDPRASQLSSPANTPPPPPEAGMQFESSLRQGGIVHPRSSNASRVSEQNSLPPHLQEKKMHEASWDSKWETYACRVDQSQEDRSVEIPLFSLARPHMRAFHFAWLSFFFAFLAWFAITPLLAEVQKSLDLTKEQIWTSSICSVAGAVVTRCISGLFCDIYGARWMSAVVLFICGVPTIFTGAVNTAAGLSILRLVTGIGGSAFVTCQYWTSTMFTKEVAGTANALAAGWGNLGGGVAQILVGSMLFPFFKWIYSSAGTEKDPAELSWRTCCIIPGLLCTGFTLVVLRSSDDSPKGNYSKRKTLGLMQKPSAMRHIKAALHDHNTWILLIQYGCCFGVELTTSNAAALYFKEEFELSTEAAAAVASTFGWMNLFARGLGGFLSDISNAYSGMRGRLVWQLACFMLEGVFVMVFSRAKSLAGAITALMTFSLFVQGAEGSTFGVVPYLNPNVTGTVAGIVGAGGNAGAVIFSIMFRQMDYRNAFFWMGAATSAISLLSSFVWIRGYEGLFFKRRVYTVPQEAQEKASNDDTKPPSTSIQAGEGVQQSSQSNLDHEPMHSSFKTHPTHES